MSESQCPICGSVEFYVKDPEDEFQTYDLKLCNGKITFSGNDSDSELPEIGDDTTLNCNCCTWNGELKKLKQSKEH
jgi:hypothetical protein